MSSIHFIGGEKGGVGKSLTSRLLAQYMIDQQIPFLGFDTDRSHGALLRFYEGFASPVVLDKREAFDVVVEAATESPERRILVDLAAQTHDPLVQWIDDAGVIELAQEPVSYTHLDVYKRQDRRGRPVAQRVPGGARLCAAPAAER